jgi:hypothetical protein
MTQLVRHVWPSSWENACCHRAESAPSVLHAKRIFTGRPPNPSTQSKTPLPSRRQPLKGRRALVGRGGMRRPARPIWTNLAYRLGSIATDVT